MTCKAYALKVFKRFVIKSSKLTTFLSPIVFLIDFVKPKQTIGNKDFKKYNYEKLYYKISCFKN